MIRSLDINYVQSTYIENDKLIFKMKDSYLIDRFEASVGEEIQICERFTIGSHPKFVDSDVCFLIFADSGQIIICDYIMNIYTWCYDYEVDKLIDYIKNFAEMDVIHF